MYLPTKFFSVSLLFAFGLLFTTNGLFAQTDFWDSAVNGNWLDNTKWADGSAPTATDNVVINATGSDYDVSLANNYTINSLAMSSSNARLLVTSSGGLHTLTINGNADIFAGTIASSGSVLFDTANGITNSGGLFQSLGHAGTTINNGFQNQFGNTLSVFGVRNASGTATFGAELNVNGGLNNNGLVELKTSRGANGGVFAILDVSGTLNNSGTIDSKLFEGHAAGGKTVKADQLINTGTIVNNDVSPLNLNKFSASYDNSGVINAANGRVDFDSVDSFINQATGQLIGTEFEIGGHSSGDTSFTNLGTINLTDDLRFSSIDQFENSGNINVGGDLTFNFRTYSHKTGATLNGGNLLNFANSTLDLEDGFETTFSNINLTNADIEGNGIYTSGASSTTNANGVTVQSTVNWENHGQVNVASSGTVTSNFNGDFTNESGGNLLVQGAVHSAGNTTVTANIAGDLTNDGTISMQSYLNTGSSSSVALLDVNGTLHNLGKIESQPLAGVSEQATKVIRTPQLINDGIVENNGGLVRFAENGADYINSGLIDAKEDRTEFNSIGSFLNSGVIRVADGAELRIQGGTVTNGIDGIITGDGLFWRSSGTFIDEGTISPGSSPGKLMLQTQGYVQTATGVLDMEINGLVAESEYDQLEFTWPFASTFNGTLRVTFGDGFAPSMGDEFDLILGSNIIDNFAAVEIFGLRDGFEYSIDNSGGSITLIANNNGLAIPEPTGALALCLLASGLCFYRRRTSRRHASQ